MANRGPGGSWFEESGAHFPLWLFAKRFERSLQDEEFRLRMLRSSDIGMVLVR